MQAELRALIERSIDALDIEISTIKSENPVHKISVKNGKFIEKIEENFVYDFELDDVIEFKENTLFEINHNDKVFKGVILDSKGLNLTLAIEKEELGENLHQFFLVFDPIYNELNLKSALNKILDRDKILNEDLLSKLFGVYSINPRKDTSIQVNANLDEYQLECIQHSLGTDCSFIWAMPGTGKTAMLIHLMDNLLRSHDSILLLTNSTETVDKTFSEYLSHFGKINRDLTNGGIYRSGIILNKDLREFVNREKVIQAKSEPRIEAINKKQEKVKEVNDEIKKVQIQISDSNELQKQFENHKIYQEQLSSIQSRFKSVSDELKNISENLDQTKKEEIQKNEELKSSEKLSPVSRVLKRIQAPEKIKEILVSLKNKKEEIQKLKIEKEKTLQLHKTELETVQKDISEITAKIKSFTEKYKDEPLEENHLIQAKLNDLNGRLKHLRYDISKLENEVKEIEKVAIQEAKIIGANINGFHLSGDLQSKEFDVIIIDEASAAILPKILFAGTFAKKKIIVIGDFQLQKPQVFAEANEHVRTWIKRNIFELLNIYDETTNKVVLDFRVATLRRQKKYSEAITEILNNCFYEKRLTNFISADNFLPGEKPVTLIDTSSIDPFNFVDEDHNQFNFHNAVITLEQAQKYAGNPNVNSICIFTLHKAQANLISKLVSDYNLTNKITVEFPENCAVNLSDVLILDIAEGKNSNSSPLSKKVSDDLYKHYFNFAVSKTYKKMIVVVNRKHLLANIAILNNSIIKLLSTITKNASENFEVLDSSSFLKETEMNFDNGALEYLKKPLLYLNEKSFVESYRFESLNNIKEIVIYAPTISLDEINKNYLDHFKELRNKNVNIGIITAPPTEQNIDISGIIEVLSNLGIKFIFSEGIIEKIIILDNRIIYFGNFNILDPNNENHNMFRINLEKTGSELLKHYNASLFTESFKIVKISKEISEDLPF